MHIYYLFFPRTQVKDGGRLILAVKDFAHLLFWKLKIVGGELKLHRENLQQKDQSPPAPSQAKLDRLLLSNEHL